MTRYLRFIVTGIAKPLIFVVEKREWDRISAVFEQYRDGSLPTFAGFLTGDNRVIHVNTRFVLLYQALVQSGRERLNDETRPPTEGINQNRVTFFIDGIDQPIHYDDIDDGELTDLTTGLELFNPDKHQFISFVDSQGGQHAVRGERLILVEVPSNTAEPDDSPV